MSEIENILLRDLYKDLPEVPVVERQGLGAMTGRGTVTTQQDTQQRDISSAQSSVAEYMKKIIQKQIQDGASISAAAQDVPFDPAIDNMETLSARGYDSDDVLRSSVATGAVSATKQKNVRRDVMEQAERMIQEMQQERTPVRKQEIQDYLTGVDIDKAQGNLEDSVLETISGILGVPVPPKDTTTEDDSVTIEDAPDADVVLDKPVEITEEGLMSPKTVAEEDPRGRVRPKARPEVEIKDNKGFNFKDTSIKLVSDLMKDFDLTKTQAAALVGNLAWESDNYRGMQEYEPAVKGSRGGYGFAQWTGARRRMFEAWSKENELDPNSYEANYGFLKFELSSANNEIGNMGVNTIKKLKETKDLDAATSIVMNEYLRPGIPHEEKRRKRSSQILDLI